MDHYTITYTSTPGVQYHDNWTATITDQDDVIQTVYTSDSLREIVIISERDVRLMAEADAKFEPKVIKTSARLFFEKHGHNNYPH